MAPPRSGRSTALLTMVNSLLRAGTKVLVITPRRSPLRALDAAPGVLGVLGPDLTPDDVTTAVSGVDLHVEVDLEQLRPVLLAGQRAVGAEEPQPADLDPVAQASPPLAIGAAGGGISSTNVTIDRPAVPICRFTICSTAVIAFGPSGSSPLQRR